MERTSMLLLVLKTSNYYLCVKIICVNQERWCSGDSSHGQARGFPRHRFYDKSKMKVTKSYNALSVDNDKLIRINLSDDQKKLYQSISTPDCPLFIESKVIDNNRVEITKVHNINDSDNIYSLLNFVRNTLLIIISLVIIISIFL